ncbi:hypothetical protein [Marivirga sp.]|uniref:hypothetical protein n=1 Tax=Marivirga sp. TaxID=2018662 RepID=UPI003DA71DDB
MKTDKKKKDFDAVKMMRDIRKDISLEIKDMSFQELRAYLDNQLAKKSRLIGQK